MNKRNGNVHVEFYGYGHGTNGFQSKPKAKWKTNNIIFIVWHACSSACVCVSLSSRTFQWCWWILNAECNKSSPNLAFNVTSRKYGMHATMVTFGQDQVNSTKRQQHEWILKWMRYYHIWLIYVCMYMEFDYGAGGRSWPPRYYYPLFSVIFTSLCVWTRIWYYFMHSMWSVGRWVSVNRDCMLPWCLYWLRSDYYWHVRTKHEYLMLLSLWMCIKNWDYHNRPCCWRAKSLPTQTNARFLSTLPQKIKTTFMALLSTATWAVWRKKKHFPAQKL